MRATHLDRLESRRLLTSLALDAFYGDGGLVEVGYEQAFFSSARAVVALPDGRALVAGPDYDQFPGYAKNVVIARLDFDGSLDPTFGTGGLQTVDLGLLEGVEARVEDLAIGMDGSIVLAAQTRSGNYSGRVARLTADGVPDPTFGTDGVVVADAGVQQVHVGQDGRITAAGGTGGDAPSATVRRWLADGTVDASFDDDGVFHLADAAPSLGATSSFSSVAVLGDGSVVAGGVLGPYWDSANNRTMLVRVDSAGELDPGFGQDGIATHRVAGSAFGAGALAVADDGGYLAAADRRGFGVAKFRPDGRVDAAYGRDGFAEVPAFRFETGWVTGVDAVTMPDGRLVVAAHRMVTGLSGYVMGVFSTSGVVQTTADVYLGHQAMGGDGLAAQPDGRVLVVSGRATYPLTDHEGWRIERYRVGPDAAKGIRLLGDILTVTGDDAANTLEVDRDSAGTWTLTLDGQTTTFGSELAARRVDARLLGGDDTVVLGPGIPAGMVDLGAGNDLARVNAPTLKLLGGEGDDTFEFPPQPASAATFTSAPDGGAGVDTLRLLGSAGGDDYSIAGGSTECSCSGTNPIRDVTVTGPGYELHLGEYGDLVERLMVIAGDGDDHFAADLGRGPTVVVTAGRGNDSATVAGPTERELRFEGGSGDDHVDAAVPANVTFDPGDGSDTFAVRFGGGNDTVRVATTYVGSSYSGAIVTVTDPTKVVGATVDAGAGSDRIGVVRGTASFPVTIAGGAGNDLLEVGINDPFTAYSGIRFDAGGDPGDSVRVFTMDAPAALVVAGGGIAAAGGTPTLVWSGLDELLVSHPESSPRELTVEDAIGFNSFRFFGSAGPDTVTLLPGITGLTRADLNGGRGDDTFRVAAVAGLSARVAGEFFPADNGGRAPDPEVLDFDRLEVTAPDDAVVTLALGRTGAGRYDITGLDGGAAKVDFAGIESLSGPVWPTTPNSGFLFESRQQAVIPLSGVPDRFDPTGVTLMDAATGDPIPRANWSVRLDVDSPAIIVESTEPDTTFADGNYVLRVAAGSVSVDGDPLAANVRLDFFVLAGDANRDRQVSLADFLILRANFGQSGKVFSEGDFNYDGRVSLADFLILRGNFGESLPPPPSAAPVPRLFAGGGKDGEEEGGRRNVTLLR